MVFGAIIVALVVIVITLVFMVLEKNHELKKPKNRKRRK